MFDRHFRDVQVINRVHVEQLRGALANLSAGDRDVLLLIALAGLT